MTILIEKYFQDILFRMFFFSPQDTRRQKKTLKKTRKFIVDGVEVSVTTSKIITDNDAKNEEMRFLRYPSTRLHLHPTLIRQPNANIMKTTRTGSSVSDLTVRVKLSVTLAC